MSEKPTNEALSEVDKHICELEQTILEQRENIKRLTLALQSSEIGAWDLDLQTLKCWRTLKHDQIFGYSQLQPEWTYEKFLTHVVPEDRHWVDRLHQEAFRNGVYKAEYRINANGTVKWISAQGRLYLNADGKTSRMIGTVTELETDKLPKGNTKFSLAKSLPEALNVVRPQQLELTDYARLDGRIENLQTFSKPLTNCGNAMNQIVGKLQLEEIGFNVDVCSSGLEALKSFTQNKYSIIFMDCHMPEMDGYKTCLEMRSLESKTKTRTPIVAVTASVLAGEKEKCLAAGMDDYLTKPVQIESLYAVCSRWLTISDEKSNISSQTDSTLNLKNIFADKILDRTKLVKNFGEEAARELMDLYIRDCGSLLLDLDDCLKNKRLEGAVFAAHTLYGASRIIKADTLAEHCKKLELSLNMDSWEDCRKLFCQIQTQHKLVLAELQNEVGEAIA